MSSVVPQQSFVPALLRAFWMLFGNGVVLVIALMIARMPPWSLSWRDLLFAASVGCLVWARWLDTRRYGGTAADGGPMTLALLLRWTATVVASTLALWVLVQSIGF
jgi:hypothetical protein